MPLIVVVLLFLSTPAVANYNFEHLRDCFLQTQKGEKPSGKSHFLGTLQENKENHVFNALFFQEEIMGKPVIHVIQNNQASNRVGLLKRLGGARSGTPNVMHSIHFASSDSRDRCPVRESASVAEIGTRCFRDETETSCGHFNIALTPSQNKMCPPRHTADRARRPGEVLREYDLLTGQFKGNKDDPPPKPVHREGKIRTLSKVESESIVRAAIVDRLQNLQVALQQDPSLFEKEELLKALHQETGSCSKVFPYHDQAIVTGLASTLCVLDTKDRSLCNIGDYPILSPGLPKSFDEVVPEEGLVPTNYVPEENQSGN